MSIAKMSFTTILRSLSRKRRSSHDYRSFREAVQRSGLFDSDWYLATYRDVLVIGMDPLDHFCRYGAYEFRNPSARFDSRAYAERWLPDGNRDISPLEHFLKAGSLAGTRAIPISETPAGYGPRPAGRLVADDRLFVKLTRESGLFDPAWYLKTYADVSSRGIDPLVHFIMGGAEELRNPGPGFDSDHYAATYPEFSTRASSPFEHFVRYGKALGHTPQRSSRYDTWTGLFDILTDQDIGSIRQHIADLPFPAVTIVLNRASAGAESLSAMLKSFSMQLVKDWTAILVTANGDSPGSIFRDSGIDPASDRIRCAGSIDELRTSLSGDYVLAIQGETILRQHALYMLLERARRSHSDFVYCDHDFIDAAGVRSGPAFKPEFSRELLRRTDYIGPCGLFTRALFLEASACESGWSGDGWVSGMLHAALSAAGTKPPKIERVPNILYHVAGEPRKPARRQQVDPALPAEECPKVSIIIPTRNQCDLLRNCIDSIRTKTAYPDDRLELVILDNGSDSADSLAYLATLSGKPDTRVVRDDRPFNFAQLNNVGAAHATGQVFLFLNNDTEVISPDWLRLMASYAMQGDVGAVGCKLLYPDGTIQHAGTTVGVQGIGAHLLHGQPDSDANDDATRELAAVTAACLAIRRDVFFEIGQYDPVLRVAFNDVKLCLASLKAGYRNIYVSKPLLIHHESKSRGYDDTPAKMALQKREAIYVRRQYAPLFQNDPFYSPNLSLQRCGDIAFPPRTVKPWRFHRAGDARPTVLFLSCIHEAGYGVPVVVQQQAAHLRAKGFRVLVGGPSGKTEAAYPSCERVRLGNAASAAAYAVQHDVDCIVVHTPPFYSIVRWLGSYPATIFFDHGEPDPQLFGDRDVRENVIWEKRICFPLASRVFAVSTTVRNQSMEPAAVVARNGNTHMATWDESCRARRDDVRGRNGWTGKLVILNVCRFAKEERTYKGVDKYIEVMKEFPYLFPMWQERAIFVLCGKATPDDVRYARAEGLHVHDNVSDEDMKDLYAAADVYMSFSRWEGYNLGIGQALAMGLQVIASDIEAHREFPITTTNDVMVATDKLDELGRGILGGRLSRRPVMEPWQNQVAALEKAVLEEYHSAAAIDRR